MTKIYCDIADKKIIKIFNKNFYRESLDDLKKGNGIVVSPEGFSRSTEESPGDFKIGVFKLATKLKNQPKIVPIIMANFDKLVHNNDTVFVKGSNGTGLYKFCKNLEKKYELGE